MARLRRKRKQTGYALTRGTSHPSAKLTEAMVVAIRRAHGSHAKIGRQFGIAPNTVGKIKRGETWAWLKSADVQS